MNTDLPIQALKEEIGKPELFTGRKKDLDYFLDWIEMVKEELGRSRVILARKRRGKTALVQRLYNVLYTRNDPKIIPFYIRIDEGPTTQLGFSVRLLCSLLSQYLGYKRRDPDLIRNHLNLSRLKETVADPFILRIVEDMEEYVRENQPEPAWEIAREAGHMISSANDERIVQIIDEFQFLNDRVYVDKDSKRLIPLGNFYQRTGSSKVSPQIITGSYIGWLSQIVRRMVGRYKQYFLEPLPHDEALAAIFNYSSVLGREVTDQSATYIAEACYNDPYYIAQIFESPCPERDLTSVDTIRNILIYETSPKGDITQMWMEYLWHAFEKINGKNAKKVVLYLARYGKEERDRPQILEDLKLDISDEDLESMLHKLVRADLIAGGSSNFNYQGLGDPIFEIVFRRTYQDEIERVSSQEIDDDINRQLKSLKGSVSYYKGIAAEYRVVNRLSFLEGAPPEKLFGNVPPGFTLGPFVAMGKRSFQSGQEERIEVDIFGEAKNEEGPDLVVEVKDWERGVDRAQIEAFIETRDRLEARLERPAVFLFYSERALTGEQTARLTEAGIMFTDGTRLSSGRS